MRETLASTSSSTNVIPPAESAWINAHERLSPRWQSFVLPPQSAIPIVISRVNQVDAGRLDVEMSAMLKEQLVKVFSVMKPGLLFQYEAELDAFLEFLIWRFSIWVDKPTPGNALMNLRYRDERAVEMRGKIRTGLEGPGLTIAQKIWYCIATVGGQYIWTRLQSFSAFRRWGDSEQRSVAHRAWFIIQRIEGFYKAASFTNLLIFFCTGRKALNTCTCVLASYRTYLSALYKPVMPNHKVRNCEPLTFEMAAVAWVLIKNIGAGLVCLHSVYRNLIERALRARLVYGSPHMNRAVSFEYMNRQLVWNEFSEMLLLLLPILNSSSIKSLFRPFSKDKSSSGSGGDETLCPICQANPTIAYVALPCHHRYCYYCLRTRCASTTSFRCSRCNEPVVAMQQQSSINT